MSVTLPRDPYQAYALLRREDPVHRASPGLYLVTRYDDVRSLLRDARMRHWTHSLDEGPPFQRGLGRWLRLLDPRTGSHLHELVAGLLSPEACAARRPRMEAAARRLVGRAGRADAFDVVRDLAEPLTLEVTAELLGLAEADRPRFAPLADRLGSALPRLLLGDATGVDADALGELAELVAACAAGKRGRDRVEDLIGALIRAGELGDDVRPGDVITFTLVFLYAGRENIMNFIGNGALALASRPDVWRRLREEAALWPGAVEELLRFDSSVQAVHLVAREAIQVAGRRIEAGEAVLALLGSANRDERQFHEPDVVDVARRPNPHLGFGAGALYCVGASLARAQATAALQALVAAIDPPFAPFGELVYRDTPSVLRGLASLALRRA